MLIEQIIEFELRGAWPVAYAGFSKGGARKFRKFENNKDQNENFSSRNQSVFPVQKRPKKKVFTQNWSGFWPKIRWRKKKKKDLHPNLIRFLVFACRLCSQTFCPNYKGGTMTQFCILFYANYTILATQRGGGHGPMAPPKYATGPGRMCALRLVIFMTKQKSQRKTFEWIIIYS